MSTPILPLAVWQSGTNQNSIPANDNALRIEALNREVISQAVTAQPASPADGDTYIIASTHTGAQWAGFTPKDIAIFKSGTWYAWAPTEGLVANVAGSSFKFEGGSWVSAGGGGSTAWGDLTGIPTNITNLAGLTDPGADRLLFWDDSAAVYTHLQIGTNLSITGTTLDAAGGSGAVSSVNGQTGAVSLALDDLSDVSAASPTSGYFLSWNGTAWVPAAGGGGGGGLTNFTESLNTTSPNSGSWGVSQLLAAGTPTSLDFAISPKGGGAIIAQIADGSTTGGNKRGAFAVDFQQSRSTAAQVASGQGAAILYGENNTASGQFSFAGGSGSTASGTTSLAVGTGARATGPNSFATGETTLADAEYSQAHGKRSSTRGVIGARAFSSNWVNFTADQQERIYILSGNNGGTRILSTDGSATPSANNQAGLPDYTAGAFFGHCAANNGADCSAWKLEGAFERRAGTIALMGTPTVTLLGQTAGASGWGLAITVDNSLKTLTITATSSAGVRFTCRLVVAEAG